MSKVITFSRTFPSYHPKKGQPTHFVEKVWKSLGVEFIDKDSIYPSLSIDLPYDKDTYYKLRYIIYFGARKYKTPLIFPKHHTIRAGHRWKVGDIFSPRIWSDKPYHSKQIIIAPDIEIKKIWYFEISEDRIFIESDYDIFCKEYTDNIATIAQNDGLQKLDFIDWFTLSPKFKKNKSFSGQIICWNDDINY